MTRSDFVFRTEIKSLDYANGLITDLWNTKNDLYSKKLPSNNFIDQTPILFDENMEKKDILFISGNKVVEEITKNFNEDSIRLNELSKYACGNDNSWNHIYLYPFKTNDFDGIDEIMDFDPDFETQLIGIMMGVVEYLRPKVVIIIDTNVVSVLEKRQLIMGYNSYEIEGDVDYTHFANLGFGSIPLYPTCKLNGEGAMDRGSFELLKRSVKRTLDSNK